MNQTNIFFAISLTSLGDSDYQCYHREGGGHLNSDDSLSAPSTEKNVVKEYDIF